MKTRKYGFLLALTMFFLFACSKEDESAIDSEQSIRQVIDEEAISHFPANPSHQDNILLTIEEGSYFHESIESIAIDASEFGVKEPIVMDDLLNEITIGIEDDSQAGEKTLTVVVEYTDGEVQTVEEIVTLVESERAGNDPLNFDWDEARIYFALTDRFYNGDATNDNPFNEEIDLTHFETYHGGDFQGLIEKMPYLADLGINTLWITPIVDNIDWNVRGTENDSQYGYHGYWAKDFTKLDEHLGTLETFHKLIEIAHDNGIKLMVDVVLNHTGYGMKVTDEGEGILNYPTENEQAIFKDMIRIEPVQNHQVVGELSGLPDLLTEEAGIRNQIIAWQSDWLEQARTPRGDTIDFYRVDTVKHVEDTTWKAFKNTLVDIKPDFKLIGEDYGASIAKNGGYLHDGEMDSLLDFDFKNIASSFVNWDVMGAQESLIARNELLSSDATMGQFLSSHDEDGFLYRQAGGDVGKQKVAASLLITAKGQPVIYYGEEIALTGAAAKNMANGEYSENRYDFVWEAVGGSGKDMHDHYKKLLNIRKNYSKLFSKGTRATIAGSNKDGYLVFSRQHLEQTVLVGLNILDQQTLVTVDVPFKPNEIVQDLYSGNSYTVSDDGSITLTLPSRNDGGTVILMVE